jgi:AhpD family alkylhydroperoxidase
MVKLRASQINGCAYCVDMHWKDARANGETEQRLYSLSVWHESPFYTERERAALLWTESLTLISENHVPDAIYEEVRQHFTEKELVDLTATIALINAWNRFGISFRDRRHLSAQAPCGGSNSLKWSSHAYVGDRWSHPASVSPHDPAPCLTAARLPRFRAG